MRAATHVLPAGYGADIDANFWRAKEDTPVYLAPEEYAKPGHVIAYRVSDGERLHVMKCHLKEYTP